MTGASRGIGAAVARRFAAEGARLVLVARTTGGLEEVDDAVQSASGEPATLVPMDLRDGEQIDRWAVPCPSVSAASIFSSPTPARWGQLSPVGHYAPEDWEQTVGLNLGANWRLIRSLDPLLRASLRAGQSSSLPPSPRPRLPSGGPMQQARPVWKRWFDATRRRRDAARFGSTCSIPARWRRSCAAAPTPARTPSRLPAPDDVTEPFVALAEASCEEHGARIGPASGAPRGS